MSLGLVHRLGDKELGTRRADQLTNALRTTAGRWARGEHALRPCH